MIIKGIPFQIWRKATRICTGFFFVSAILSPLFALIFYLFAQDFDYLMVKNQTQKKQTYVQKLAAPLEEKHSPYIPLPNIKDHLKFINYNDRPDSSIDSENLLSLSIGGVPLNAKLQERIYLNCNDFENICFSEEKSSYSITPVSIKNNTLTVVFEVVYLSKNKEIVFENKENIEILKLTNSPNPLSCSSIAALKSLKKSLYFSPDALISLLGGESFSDKKQLHRLYFPENKGEQTLYIKADHFLCFENGNWLKKESLSQSCPLFKIDSIHQNFLKGTFWNENGFFEEQIQIDLNKAKTSSIANFSFDKLYKRNKESVICKIEDKTFILKQNDLLVKKGTSWSLVLDIEEFNDLINLKTLTNIIIFDTIKQDKENELFIGYIFDESRSDYKKLEILLKKNDDLR